MLPLSLGNPHRDRLIAAFGPLRPDPGPVPTDLDFLFLLFTNRCGSNFLAQVLASTGRFNEAGEFFNADTVLSHADRNGLTSLPAYFGFVSRLVARGNRMTAKLGIEHIALLSEAGILDAILPRSRFILLERQDRLAQAISRLIAAQTLQWTSEQPRRVSDDRLVYARSRIEEEISRVELGNNLLRRFLTAAGVAPLHFAYEALVARPQSHLDEVAAWLPLPGLRFDPGRIRITRQANAVNVAWQQGYLAGD
jgi:LPS sulfotransferase NodH